MVNYRKLRFYVIGVFTELSFKKILTHSVVGK